jgi:predicted amino acid dehydrogenase
VGEVILIPRLPDEIIYGTGRALIASAVEIAALRGSRVVGLGGLTAPATHGGSSLVANLPPGITLTNGNSFTAAVARKNVLDACEVLGATRPTVAVLGSTGSVGTVVSELLAGDNLDLLLIGRSTARARAAAGALADKVQVSSELSAVADADIVIVLTGDKSARLSPESFPPDRERVVIDVAQPPNIPVDQRPAYRARRARVVRGGWVQIPGTISSHLPDRLMTEGDPSAPPGTAPACLAEAWLYATTGIRDHAVGAGSSELARLLSRLAIKRGVQRRSLVWA